MTFLNITFLAIIVNLGFFMFYPLAHTYSLVRPSEYCGPFADGYYWYGAIEDFFNQG